MSVRRACVIAALSCLIAGTAAHADDAARWTEIEPPQRRIGWAAAGLSDMPQMAESFTAPLGYRLERYLWKAQKPAGTFAIAVLRDLTDDDHYLSGPVDLMKFATAVLKGLEAPVPKALDDKDRRLGTGAGIGLSRRFELGPRQCMVLGLYAAPNGKPARTDEPLTEGSLRMDAVYCVAAGQPLPPEAAAAVAANLKMSAPK
ncbi:hypothetical protein [Ferrovibrio sp.]|uniref:hypothetical protein n=1 Tax=Ferrovibrio sp. TaxID=1917215 RepID=UPI00311F4ECF